jgi:hypothetical protein
MTLDVNAADVIAARARSSSLSRSYIVRAVLARFAAWFVVGRSGVLSWMKDDK